MTKQITLIPVMGFFSFLFGCKNNNNQNVQKSNIESSNLEEITSRIDVEEGWKDIFLKIIEDKRTDTSHIYIAKGLYKEEVVGLQIEISSKINAGFIGDEIDNKNGFVLKGVSFKSIGKESDELVNALAELYEFSMKKSFTKQTISATVFSLNEKKVNLAKNDYYKLKLFFEEDNEDLYSELYLNINTETKEIELHEKDEEYRVPIIKVLTN